MYNKQKSWAVGSDINKINELIKKVGSNFDLTDEKMDKCLKNDQSQDEILEQRINAQKKYKIESTPTIIINEKKYSGKVDYKQLAYGVGNSKKNALADATQKLNTWRNTFITIT